MDPKHRLNKYLDTIEEIAHKGGDFLADEVPLLCREILDYHVTYYLTWAIVLGVVVLFLWWFAATMLKSAGRLRDSDDRAAVRVVAGVCLLVSILPLLLSIGDALQVVKAKTAPRVLLVEKVRCLLR